MTFDEEEAVKMSVNPAVAFTHEITNVSYFALDTFEDNIEEGGSFVFTKFY